jgi:hypothetical protein
MACSNCNCSNNTCGCKDLPLTTAPVYTCPPDITCPDPTPCYETIQDTCVKHGNYSIINFGALLADGNSYPALPAGASLENAYQAMSITAYDSDCPPPINVHVSYIGTTAIIINWELTGADTYTFGYGTNPSGPWTDVAGLITNTYTLTLLSSNTTYYFRVKTVCNLTATTSTSAIIAVTTLTA